MFFLLYVRDGVAHVSVGNYTTHNIQTSPAETESNQSIFTSSRVEPASTDILTTKRDTGLQCQDVHKGQAASKRGRKESNETTPIPAKKRRLGCSGRGGLTDSLLVTAARGALLLLAADAAQGDTKARNSLQQLMERRLDTRQDVSVVSPMDATSTGVFECLISCAHVIVVLIVVVSGKSGKSCMVSLF